MNTTTQRIYDYHLARTNSKLRAWTATQLALAYLIAVTEYDAKHVPVSAWTATVRRNDLRAAGLAPIDTSEALVQVARDLGVSDIKSLIRLVRAFNSMETRSNKTTTGRYFELIAQAFATLSSPDDEAMPARVAASLR